MNRRNFLKSAGVALAALALGIKRKISGEIVTGVGRGSPQLIDNSGVIVAQSGKLEISISEGKWVDITDFQKAIISNGETFQEINL